MRNKETSSIYDTPNWVFFNFSLRMRGFEFQVFQERERKGAGAMKMGRPCDP